MSKPEQVFKMGAVRASVFRNSMMRDGKSVSIGKVIIEVRYKDKSGEWKGTNSLSLNELPKAITALQKAYEYLLEHAKPEDEQPEIEPASAVHLGLH